MEPDDLIQIAKELINPEQPPQANLKRAISSAYYAMFHALCSECANSLVGCERNPTRSRRAWNQAYRSVDHGETKNRCLKHEVMKSFPEEIRNFAENFVWLQELRCEADYDPAISFNQNEAITAIKIAQTMIAELRGSKLKDRKAFAVWLTMKKRNKTVELDRNPPKWIRRIEDRREFR